MTKRKFKVENEKQKIIKLYLDMREILETTLKSMKGDDDLTASKLDVCLRAIKLMPGLLLELEKLKNDSERKLQREKDLEDVKANLPAPLEPFPEEPPTVKLPFPMRGLK